VYDSRWVAVVPVKDPKLAKSRLGPQLEPWRTDLAAAFATDLLTALLASSRFELVVVVGGRRLPTDLLDHGRLRTLPDPGDLNAAVSHGIDWARQQEPTAAALVLAADLPAATDAVINRLLDSIRTGPLHVIPDLEGIGSTGLLLGPETEMTPAFGDASLARHQAAGAAVVELPGIERLRRDVDTADQLAAAVELGVGERTRSVLTEMAAATPSRLLP
jgi:2-phospho-L-lactate/phosphoenolpyruvate guanylyltransferase